MIEAVDGGGEADRELMDALFTPEGRLDPQAAASAHPTLGCRHAVVDRVLRDARTAAPVIDAPPVPLFDLLRRFMARLDGDRHHAVRSRFARIFTPRKAAAFSDLIEQRANALLDDLERDHDGGAVDLVAAFARPLPFGVVADVMGIPPAEQPWFRDTLDQILSSFANQRDPDAVRVGSALTQEVLVAVDALLHTRRGAPADDLLSVLAADEVDGDAHQDLLANCVFFLTAGHATTTALLAGGTALLSARPKYLELNRADPTRWEATVEELLRYLSPITITGAAVPEAVDVDGIVFQPGPHRLLCFAAANRDPAVFEHPDRFDPSRPAGPHLAFSVGPHHCLGAPLARLHGNIGLRVLFDRLPHLVVVDGPRWRSGAPVRQLDSLHVTW